jgi:hypothetical protein
MLQEGIDLSRLFSRLMQGNVMLGIVLAIIGLTLSLISTRFCRMVRKTSHVDANDRLIIIMKSFGLILILVALVIIVVE